MQQIMFQFHFNEAQFLIVLHYNELKSLKASTLHLAEDNGSEYQVSMMGFYIPIELVRVR